MEVVAEGAETDSDAVELYQLGCEYAQGFALIKAGDKEHDWQLPMDKVASVWRAGCIIRAHLLEDIRRAFAAKHDLTNLLIDDHFAGLMAECQQNSSFIALQRLKDFIRERFCEFYS